VPVLLAVASSYDSEKSCTPLDHVPRCDESHITSLRRSDAGKTSSLSDLMTACLNIHGPHDLSDLRC
jgi:hypothetical protein